MKLVTTLITVCIVSLFSTGVFAQTLEDRIKVLEETLKKQEQTIAEQRKLIEGLRFETKQAQLASQPDGTDAKETAPPGEIQQQVQELNEKVEQVAEAQTRTFPGIFNPAIGVVGETIFSYRSKGSSETGSSRPGGYDVFQRSVELNAAASVDPFAKAYIVVNGSADPVTGELAWGLEEAALQTTSLPWNLELKAGRFFGEFGRLAYIHDHELPVVNRPLVLDQYIGGESRTDGAQLNWLLPVDHYISLTTGLGTQFGGDSPNPNNVGTFRKVSGLNFWGRLSTFFNLTPDIALEPGVSGLWNPKTIDRGGAFAQPDGSSLTERERRLYGADLVLSYKPLRNNQFRSLTWGTEVLYSDNRYDVTDASANALPGRTFGSLGLYSYLAYKLDREWTTAFNFDWVEDAQNKHAQTFAYSPNITYALSHWNQLRLQYTYTDHNAASETYGLRPDHAVYLQWSWIIGAHSHGWQSR
jgi:hypothetical protein